jgi:AcrR family transcriptional regulator
MRKAPAKKALPKPHKRPSQERSQFTVQTLYDAFVRIWQRDGPAAATMRAIAAEAGYAVGTLYEYFPNRDAVLSGYFRYCVDDLCQRMRDADANTELAWQQRLRKLVSVTLDEAQQAPYFDADMLLLESRIADGPQHRKAFARLCDAWRGRLSSWPDLPTLPSDAVDALVLNLWGARRYAIVLGRHREQSCATEVNRTTAMLEALLMSCVANR